MDKCYLCKSEKVNDIQYGEFLRNSQMGFGVHTFCLYLSSNLTQNGDDDEGYLGFLKADIKNEEIRISRLTCCYCRKKYANIGCCEKKCHRTFHFICGLENGAENQFCQSFRSYCHTHRRKGPKLPGTDTTCTICYDKLFESNDPTAKWSIVKSPCCRNGWFHKLCLQRFAKNAGYFFKCPLCNDAKIFRQKLPAQGIFIPNQDAAWELEPNAYVELLERPNECTAKECQNRNGRTYSSTANPLILCATCGSTAIHKQCLPHSNRGRFHCADCTIAFQQHDGDDENALVHDEEAEEIDVCHVSDNEDLNIVEQLLGDVDNNKGNAQMVNRDDEDSTDEDGEISIPHRRRTRILSSDSNSSDMPPTIKMNSNYEAGQAVGNKLDKCFLCKSSKRDEIQYGEFLQNEEMEMGVHMFCLYLSSNLTQNGKDEEGFLGFLKGDIKKEELRISHLKCCYCRKQYANIGCCETKCRRSFHLICGIEHNAENQFCNSFKSFCFNHRRKKIKTPPPSTTCSICYDLLGADKWSIIQSPCCRTGWFHKLCMQKFAKTAGYFFKCPLCNDVKTFRQKLTALGIFIPNQDAAWELEPNAFAELLERPNECSAINCANNEGRSHSDSTNPLLLCRTCGSTAIHKKCLPQSDNNRFHCNDCTIAMEEEDSGRESLNSELNDKGDVLHGNKLCDVSHHENIAIINGLICDNDVSSDEEIKTKRRYKNRLSSVDSSVQPNIYSSMRRNKKASKSYKHGKSIIDSTDDEDSEEVETICGTNKGLGQQEELKSNTNLRNEEGPKCCNRDAINDGSDKRNLVKSLRWGRNTDISDDEVIIEVFSGQQNANIHKNRDRTCNLKRQQLKSIIESDEDDDDFKYNVPKKQLKIHNDNTEDDDQKDDSRRRQTSVESGSDEGGNFGNLEAHKITSDEEEEESDEDDDPLENFTKLVDRQKEISCIAQRTRNKETQSSHQNKNSQIEVKITKTITFQHEEPKTLTKSDNLDISCIARRTRRKSTATDRMDFDDYGSNSIENKVLNTSCVAIRTRGRRKTVCSETAAEKKKRETNENCVMATTNCQSIRTPRSYDMSKDSDSDEEYDNISENSESTRNSQNDGKLSPFELSCVARRTRRRKSLCIDTENSTSSSSRSIILSTIQISSNRFNHAWPKQNYVLAFCKTRSSQNYYPNNNDHPHISNRRRN